MIHLLAPLRARSRVFLVALLATLMSMAGISAASANDLHEVQNTSYDNWSYIHDAGTSTEYSVGQGFTTNYYAGEKVHHIAVWLQRTGAAENACVWLTLRQYSNTGDLGSACINAQTMGTSAQWYDFTFSSPITITPQTQYNFIVRYYGSCDNCVQMAWSSTNLYRDANGPNYRYGQSGTSCCWYGPGTDTVFLIAVDHTSVAVTQAAENVTSNSVRMVGRDDDDAGGLATNIVFYWGTTTSYGNTTSPFACQGGYTCWWDMSGISSNTTYHYKACLQNYVGEQCGGDVSFTTPAVPGATLSPSSYNFGSVTLGQTSAATTFTLSSTGTANLTVSSVTSGGTNPGDFVKQNDNCTGATIAPGNTCTFQIRFAPAAVGSRSATVTAATNAGNKTSSLSGTGVGTPVASASPTSINFGTVAVGSSSSPSSVTVSNTGTATLSVSSVSVGGSHPGDFPKSSDGCTGANVAPGGSCTFNVAFSPTAIGARSATVTINTNGGSPTVALSGTGAGTPVASVSPTSINFGTVTVGSSSPAQTVTVSNTGTANLSVTGVSIGGTNSGDFAKSADGCSGASIAPSSSCTFQVTFSPSALGSRSATATVSTNGGNPVVNLSGTGGGAPQINLSPTSVGFGNVTLGQSSSPTTITVSNTGTANLTVSTVSIGGTNASDFSKSSDTCTGATVPAGSSCTFAVSFSPSAVGSRSATVTVSSNAGNPTVALSGSGVGVPQVGVAPSSINYGTITVGSSSSAQTITVSNPGTGALSVTSVSIAGPNAADFTKSSDTCSGTSVAAGSSCTFRVTFTPGALGARSATVTVDTNAGSPTVALSGNGGGTPAASISPTSVNYGTVLAGTSSSPTTVTLTSNGTSDLTVSSVSVSGANAGEFVLSSDNCTGTTLPAGNTCTFQVTFSPTSAGSKSATVTAVTNAGNKTVSLSGTATAPAISVSPGSLSFGTVTVGSSSSPSTVTVTNTGTANLSVTGVSVSGTNASDFALGSNGCTGATVAPGATCTFTVTFTPGAGGARSATVTITSNAGNQAVALSGAGGVAAISVSPSSLNFGYVGVDPSDPQTVTVSNPGSADLSISTLTISGAAAGDYTISADSCSGATVAPGGSCTFDVTLEATVAGTRAATITVASAAGNRTVSLTGIGDLVAPVSAFSTSNNGIVLTTQSVTGTVTDDRSGVDTVTVTFTPLLPTGGSTVQALLSCNANRRSCTWSAVVPLIPGVYTVTVRATDLAGNAEFPGQTITIIDA